jgi:Lipid A 3-O-deacylase (PagL)
VYGRVCRGILIVTFALSPGAALAQTDASNLWFVRGGITPSFILPTNPFSLGSPQSADAVGWAPGFTAEIGRRTDGSNAWHELYNMPSYGFGISTVAFENHGELVRPVEAYTFFSWPFARLTNRLDMTSDFGMGLSWNWTPVHASSATPRAVLGSNLNARIDWGLYLRYMTTPRTVVYAGLDLTHRSNGGLVQPNQGINVLGPKVTVQYNFGPDVTYQLDSRPPPPFHPAWDVMVAGTGGMKNVLESTSPMVRQDFGAFEGTVAAQRQFYTFGRVAAGADLMYDGSTGAALGADGLLARAGSMQRLSTGTYAEYEHIIGRFSAFADAGYAIARTSEAPDVSRFYQRYGWRYQMNRRLFTTMAIRATGGKKADVFEVGVGYRLVTSR